ncbi:MAG: hypothetical protein IKS55_02655 [Oscillospiraceae bacterium]|nr:hypothetical protein [Oscillospiraceae bacterium]
MPKFDLRYIQIATYVNTSGTITYANKTTIGDAMGVDITYKHAEGRVFAEGVQAEFIKKLIGGSISIAEKYIPTAAHKLMFGSRDGSRTVNTNVTVAGLKLGGNDSPKYVGVSFYAPCMIDGVEKFYCMFIRRALFGPPNMSVKTMGETINFDTPTVTGEFLADNSTNLEIVEDGIATSVADAKAWCDAVLA